MKKLFIFAAVMLYASSVSAQSMQSLERDLNVLRDDVKMMQRQFYREESSSTAPQTSKEAMIKVGQMEEDVRQLRGRFDEYDYKIKQLNDRIDMINKDVDVRFKMLEGQTVSVGGKSGNSIKTFDAPVAVGAPKSIAGDSVKSGDLAPVEGAKPKLGVADVYQKGLEDLKENKYDEAEQSFLMILKDYPNEKLAGNAQYWLGETYYGKGEFDRAAVAFAGGYQKYKDSPKGPDSLLKLGLSMKALKKNDEACAAFKSLPTEFPKAALTLKDRAKKEVAELKCK